MLTQCLTSLLAFASPMQVDESEIRLAIDLMANDMLPGFEVRLSEPHEESRRGLLELLNRHPRLRALSVGTEIFVRRVK